MFNYADRHELLAIVSAVHHQRICKPLNNWALSLTEPLSRVPPSCMRKICSMFWGSHSYVISKRDIANLQIS